MGESIEKSLVVGGALVALGVGNLWGFWLGVLSGGALLFLVAFFVFLASLSAPVVEPRRDDGGRG